MKPTSTSNTTNAASTSSSNVVECSDRQLQANTKLRQQVTLTSWINQQEQSCVGRTLLTAFCAESDDSSRRLTAEQALDLVSVWKCRSNGERIPHAIESTAALAQVQLRDSYNAVTVAELRLAYSSAITRCINGFADMLQQQRSVAASVSVLCGQIGIPSWIVDVRHEASHNALPTLPVLRLAASTLMEFLCSAYWIPACLSKDAIVPSNHSTASKSDNPVSDKDKDNDKSKDKDKEDAAAELLLKYKAAMTANNSGQEARSAGTNTKAKKTAKKSILDITIPITTSIFSKSDEDSFSSGQEDDPLFGNLWGPNMGTAQNRYALLAPSKQKSSTKQQQQYQASSKNSAATKKRRRGDLSPVDYIKQFLQQVPIQDAFEMLLKFLVWGGVCGAPVGRGVLIPGSVTSFPASKLGTDRVVERYGPLIVTVCRKWPGFLHALIVNLVDFVLVLEDEGTATLMLNTRVRTIDAGSQRKLFFLSAWINFLVSGRFISRLQPAGTSSTKQLASDKSGASNSNGEELASYKSLNKLQLPLNSLCDRLSQGSSSSKDPKVFHNRITATRLATLFHTILDKNRVVNNGLILNVNTIAEQGDKPNTNAHAIGMQDDDGDDNDDDAPALPDKQQGHLSLADMEELISDSGDDENEHGGDDGHDGDKNITDISDMDTNDMVVGNIPPNVWQLCTSWDVCAIGTMPGYAS